MIVKAESELGMIEKKRLPSVLEKEPYFPASAEKRTLGLRAF
jgi:hypothetical protein